MRLEFGIGGPVSCERLSRDSSGNVHVEALVSDVIFFGSPAETATGVDKDGQVPTAPVLGSFRVIVG